MWQHQLKTNFVTEIPWRSYVNESKLPEAYKPVAAYDQVANGNIQDMRRVQLYTEPNIDTHDIKYEDPHLYNQWENLPKAAYNENLQMNNPQYFDLPDNDQAIHFDVERLSADATKSLYKDDKATKLFGKDLVDNILNTISKSNLTNAEKNQIANETIKSMQNMVEIQQDDIETGPKDNEMRQINALHGEGVATENKAGDIMSELQQKIAEYMKRKKDKIIPVNSTSRIPGMTEKEVTDFNMTDNRYVYPNPRFITNPNANTNVAWMIKFPVYYTVDGKQVSKETKDAKIGKYSKKTVYMKSWKDAIAFRDKQLKLSPRKEYVNKGKSYL